MKDKVILIFNEGLGLPTSIFKIDESRYRSEDIHYKIGINNVIKDNGKTDFYTSDLKSIIYRLNIDNNDVKFGFYTKGSEKLNYDCLKEMSGLVLFEDSENHQRSIILNFNDDVIRIVFDSTKTKENKSGDAFKLSIDKNVFLKYNVYSINYEENYLRDRVRQRERELGIRE